MEDNRQDYADAGVTFHDIFKFLKKAMPMLVIFLVLCLIVGALVGVCISVKNDIHGNIRASIEFTYNGISEGLDPIGNIFNSDSIRDIQVVSAALTNLDLQNKYDAATVRSAIKIAGVKPGAEETSDGEELNYMPSEFTITFDYKQIDGMTETEATSIVNNLMSCYLTSFKNKYIITDKLTVGFLNESDIKASDFVEIFNTITNEFNYALDYVNTLSNSQFISTKGDTLSSIKIKINAYMQKLNLIISNAKSGRVVRDKDSTLNYLNYEIKQISEEITAKNSLLTSIKDFLEAYSKQYPSVSVSGSSVANITVPKSDAFDNEFKKQTTIASKIEDLTIRKANLESWVTDLNAGPAAGSAEVLDMETKIIAFVTEMDTFIEEFNEFAIEYSGKELAENVSITSEAFTVSSFTSTPWLKIMLISLVVGILLGLIMTPVGVKIKKSFAEKKAAKQTVANKETTDDEQQMEQEVKSESDAEKK